MNQKITIKGLLQVIVTFLLAFTILANAHPEEITDLKPIELETV